MLLESINEFNKIKKHRNKIYDIYSKNLSNNNKITYLKNNDIKSKCVMWLFTILTPYKDLLQKKLRQLKVETNQVHFRNDRYSIFKKFTKNKKFPNMEKLQNQYLVLPMHTKMSFNDALNISRKINLIIKQIK